MHRVGVGALFWLSHDRGILIAIAIGLHNIPECISTSQHFMHQGKTPTSAAARACLVMIPQALATVVAYCLVAFQPAFFPLISGVSAGAVFFIVLSDVIPHARHDLSDHALASIVVFAACAFEGMRLMLDWMKYNPTMSAQMLGALGWSLFAGLSTGML
jgi:ZIP family zinc transporter